MGYEQLKLLLIGDSLIEFHNWQASFPEHRVINLGMAGETAEGLLYRSRTTIPQEFISSPPDLIKIMTGTNNLVMEDFSLISTYEKLLQTLQESFPETTILITSLLPIDLPWLSSATSERLNILLENLARQKGACFLDICPYYLDEDGSADPSFFENDRVHLSLKGYKLWTGALQIFLQKMSSS